MSINSWKRKRANPEPGIDTQFYFGHIKDPAWNLFLTMNSKSRTAEMLHRKDDAGHWARSAGHGIEELPKVELARFDDEAPCEFPPGMGIDYTDSNKINPSQTPRSNEEFEHQPSPRILTLTNDRVITMYQALNTTASQASPDTPYVCMKQTVLPFPAPDPRLTAKPTSNTGPVNRRLRDLGRAPCSCVLYGVKDKDLLSLDATPPVNHKLSHRNGLHATSGVEMCFAVGS